MHVGMYLSMSMLLLLGPCICFKIVYRELTGMQHKQNAQNTQNTQKQLVKVYILSLTTGSSTFTTRLIDNMDNNAHAHPHPRADAHAQEYTVAAIAERDVVNVVLMPL